VTPTVRNQNLSATLHSHIQKLRHVNCRGGESAIDDSECLPASSLTYEGIDIKNGTTKEEQIHNERYFMF
jgi:hypothetical protein